MNPRFVLGSAQFGMTYGIANSLGKPSLEQVRQILAVADDCGIALIDTAMSYGQSEETLGRIGVKSFGIISKLPQPPNTIGAGLSNWVVDQVNASLNRLRVSSLDALLLHQVTHLTESNGGNLIKGMCRAKELGLVKKIGVSIYSPAELDLVYRFMSPDLVQAPVNVMDRRLESSGWLDRLQRGAVEVHARSVFLQGLLLMPKQKMPARFSRWRHFWTCWEEELSRKHVSALEACLSYPLSLSQITGVVVGVECPEQLKAVAAVFDGQLHDSEWSFMECSDEQLLNPAKWGSI